MSSDVLLIAGTKVEHQRSDGTWGRAPRMKSIGAVGEQSEAKEKTTLEDRVRTYGSGMRDAADKTLNGQYIPYQSETDDYYDDYVLQQEFITRLRNEEEFNLRITWPDGEVNGFLFKSLGFEWDDIQQEDWKLFTSNGKQNSRMIYGVTVTGSSTVSSSGDEQMTLAVTPSTIEETEYSSAIVWSSSDESVATVDDNGLVSGVSSGSATITATVRGVPGSIEITVS